MTDDSSISLGAPFDPARYRADFPILSRYAPSGAPLVYLDNAATTQRPRAVIQAMVETYEQHYANVHRGIHWLSDQTTDLFENAREKVRRFIGAERAEEIIFTHGATEGINLVARAWGETFLKPGDEILLTELEHHANLVPWYQAAAKTGARIRHLPITDEGRIDLGALDQLLTERTKLVAVTAVSNVLGTMVPLESIIRRAKELGAVVLIDAAQSAPHLRMNVATLGADFVAFSGHKMLGPSGVGVLWGRQELLEAMPPFLGGGNMIRRVSLAGFEPAELPAKFEAGTPPIVPAIGLGAAIDYLEAIGLDAIHLHELALTRHAHQALSAIDGARILGPPPEEKSGVVSFVVDGLHPHDVAQLLDREGIAIRAGHHCAMPLHKRLGILASSRASFYLYNTRDEVTHFAEALVAARKRFRARPNSTAARP